MAEAADTGMDKGAMKILLGKSKTEPVNCAVGQSGKIAVMLLHKIKQPKALSKDLEKQFDDLKNGRWGTASVDMEEDPKLVILTLNRAAPGIAAKLRKTLKGTGFSKVEIRMEDGSVAESVQDEEETEEDGPEGHAPNPEAPEPPAANGTDAPAPADMGPLTQRLTALARQIGPALASDPSRKAELMGLAGAAQNAVRSGDAAAAGQAIDSLETALGQAGTGEAPANGAAAPNPAIMAKSRLAWVAARKRVEDEIGKLHEAMTQHYDGHGFGADLDKVFKAKVEPMMETLDHSLAEKLDEIASAPAADHPKLVGEARQIISRYESYLAGEPLISQLDSNPFVPLSIQKTLTATLAALGKAVN